MFGEIVRENRKRILVAVCVLALVGLALAGHAIATNLLTQAADRRADEVLATLTYTEDAAQDELDSLRVVAVDDKLSERSRGLLLKAMTEVSFMLGDDRPYNNYIAQAMYDLGAVGDEESVVYLNNKFVGRLYANGCYDAALQMLDDVNECYDLSVMTAELRASFYLSRLDVSEMLGKPSAKDAEQARKAIDDMEDGSQKELQRAKLTLLTARMAILQNNFEEARRLLEPCAETDSFGLESGNVYVICDYRIPWLELQTKILIHDGKTDEALALLDRYVDYCDVYNFRMMKLNLLRYAEKELPEGTDELQARLREASAQVLADLTMQYGDFLLYDISDIQSSMAEAAAAEQTRTVQIMEAVILGVIALLVAVSFALLISYLSRDSLTRLSNRKLYEKTRGQLERWRSPYCFLMLDIDDFKKVNDTYGHQQGDEVLRLIARVLRRFVGKNVTAYRYGGEELCMVFKNIPENLVREKAESIRAAVEKETGECGVPVTISGGLGVSLHGENVFQEADASLYYAKAHGKNQIK